MRELAEWREWMAASTRELAEWREQVVAGKTVQVIGDAAWKEELIALAAAVVVLQIKYLHQC